MENKDIAVRSAFDEYCAGLELPQFMVPFEAAPSYPTILYRKGIEVVSGLKPYNYTGYQIATGQSAKLDALFEMQNIPCVRVRYLESKKEGTFWQIDSLSGYLLMKAVPTEWGPDSWRKSGVPFVWNDHQGTYMYGSQMAVLFFLRGLLDLGYAEPLVLALSRTVTEPFLARVLRRQETLLEAIKAVRRKHGKEVSLSSYAYWLELIRDEEPFKTKKGASYLPPAAIVELTADYVQAHKIAPSHQEIIESFIPVWDAWAESTSKLLLEPPKDANDTQEASHGEDGPVTTTPKTAQKASGAEQTERAAPASDPTIIISGDVPEKLMLPLYNAIWHAKQKGVKGGVIPDEETWWDIFGKLGIAAFTQGDIKPLNDLIDAMIAKATEAAQSA